MKHNLFMSLLIATIVVIPTTLISCGDDDPENPYGENQETPEPGSSDRLPQIEIGSSNQSSSEIMAFTVTSPSTPVVYMLYAETETDSETPSLNKKKTLNSSGETYDPSTKIHSYDYKVNISDFTKGNYLFFQIVAENENGSCESEVECVSIKKTEPEISEDEKIAEMLVGKWQRIPKTTRDNMAFYVFNADRTGYFQEHEWYDGIQRDWISKWEIVNSKLVFKWAGSGRTVEWEISISDDELVMINSAKYSTTYRHINNSQTSSLDYKETPYKCYVCCLGVYYPLDVVVKQCEHGVGTEWNSKFITFRGVDESIWYQIRYFTPYYEGIDNYWPDGTYKVNVPTTASTSCWQYLGFMYVHGMKPCEDTNGTLKISHTNKHYKYTYKSEDIEIYFEGEEQ